MHLILPSLLCSPLRHTLSRCLVQLWEEGFRTIFEGRVKTSPGNTLGRKTILAEGDSYEKAQQREGAGIAGGSAWLSVGYVHGGMARNENKENRQGSGLEALVCLVKEPRCYTKGTG